MKHSDKPACFSNFTHEESAEKQELLPADIAKTIPPLYSAESNPISMAMVHLFNPMVGWDWYITLYDPEERLAFGFVKGFVPEYGYFSIKELEDINSSRGGNIILRDENFKPRPVEEIERECEAKGSSLFDWTGLI